MSDEATGSAQRAGTPRAKAAPVVPLDAKPMSEVRLLTVAEVAQIMRVSKMSIYRHIHNGELEAVRFGRTFRVPEKAVNEFVNSSYFEAG